MIPCPNCREGLHVGEKINADYFNGESIICSNCNEPVDWWDAIIKTVKGEFFLAHILAPIGARATFFKISLFPGKHLNVNLNDHHIPKNAKILEINYTPNMGGLFPLEVHGNLPFRHIPQHEITLYPIPLQTGKEPKETIVNVMVTWVPHTPDDEAWQNLVDSFEVYSQGRYSRCLLSANVAIESRLMRLLTIYLKKICSKKNVEDFLENAATYSHQLNVVLPLAAGQLGLPVLPEKIRGLLNRLRKLRNELSHSGKVRKQLNKDETSELIVAAFFGFHYLSVFEDKLKAS